MRNVVEYLEATARRLPDKVAFADEHSAVTFRELEDKARRLGTWLARRAPENRTPIAVLVERGVRSPIAFMAALMCGCCYVPLDGQMPRKRLEAILDQLEAPVILYGEGDEKLAAQLRDRYPLEPITPHLTEPEDPALLAQRRASVLDMDPVYIIFTSGSTGVPKGIVCHHRGVMDLAEWLAEAGEFTEMDVLGNQAPFYFDGSVKDLYMTLKCGATCEILPKKLFLFPKLLVDCLNQKKVTALQWATSAFHLVAASGVLAEHRPENLRTVLAGGEAMLARDLNIWRAALPEVTYINLYGPTETTVDAAWYKVDREFADYEPIPIGSACANKELFLLDEQLRPVPQGSPGEICIRGSGLAHGYFRDPETTAASFIQNPLTPHYPDRIYRTGDIALLNEEGLLVFQSRQDGQIKHMGYRIELGEIERALASFAPLKDAICFFDAPQDAIVCYYAGEADAAAILGHLKTLVPKYMQPNVFRQLDALPHNANGKVDRVKLKDAYFHETGR